MKEITLVLFTLIFSLSLFSQNCVTDIKGDDYGLQDVNGEIIFLEVDQNNNKWFGAKNYYGGGYGIGKFDGITWTEFTALGGSDLPDDRVYDIAFDTSGNVWVATHAGLAKFDGEATNGWEIFDNTDFGSTGNEVTAIAIDSGYVKWIGLSTGEVIRYNDTTFTKFTNLNGKQINTIGIDSTHNIWFGMEATLGLSRYNHDEFTSFSQYQFIRSIQTTKNFVYASDFNGLHIFNGSEWTDIAAPGYSLYHVTLNSSNDVWLSSSIGLVEFRDSIFIPYTPMNSGIPDFLTFTRPCNFDKDDKLWFSYQYKATFTTCATGFLTENAGLGLEILSDKNFTF